MCELSGLPRYVSVYFLLVETYSRLSVPHRAIARAHCSGLISHTEGKNTGKIQTRTCQMQTTGRIGFIDRSFKLQLNCAIHRCDMLSF